jgi:hypothetical protein
MSRFRSGLRILIAVLVGCAIFGTPTRAEAAFQIRITTGAGSPITLSDGDMGDESGLANDILFFGFDDLEIHAYIPSPTGVVLHITGNLSGMSSMIRVDATVTGIINPPPQTLTYSFTQNQPAPPREITFRTYVDSNNDLYGGDVPGDLLDITATTPDVNFSPPRSATFNATSAYSVTTSIIIDGIPSEGLALEVDSNNVITPTPAPAGLVLALTGLPLLGIWGWRRRVTPATRATASAC